MSGTCYIAYLSAKPGGCPADRQTPCVLPNSFAKHSWDLRLRGVDLTQHARSKRSC